MKGQPERREQARTNTGTTGTTGTRTGTGTTRRKGADAGARVCSLFSPLPLSPSPEIKGQLLVTSSWYHHIQPFQFMTSVSTAFWSSLWNIHWILFSVPFGFKGSPLNDSWQPAAYPTFDLCMLLDWVGAAKTYPSSLLDCNLSPF